MVNTAALIFDLSVYVRKLPLGHKASMEMIVDTVNSYYSDPCWEEVKKLENQDDFAEFREWIHVMIESFPGFDSANAALFRLVMTDDFPQTLCYEVEMMIGRDYDPDRNKEFDCEIFPPIDIHFQSTYFDQICTISKIKQGEAMDVANTREQIGTEILVWAALASYVHNALDLELLDSIRNIKYIEIALDDGVSCLTEVLTA